MRSFTSIRNSRFIIFSAAAAAITCLSNPVRATDTSKTPAGANFEAAQTLADGAGVKLAILDLPLIATVFFAVSRRNPVAGTLTGAAIGLLQDALTNQPIGVNGMAKSVIGYMAASVGSRIDVENTSTRAVLTFGFSLIHSALFYLIERRLLGIRGFHLLWLHELLRAAINTLVAVPTFLLLDRWKHRE